MKDGIEKTLNKYLPNLKLKLTVIEIENAPLFLKEFYRFDELLIDEKPFLVINVKDRALGPREFKKHSRLLAEKLNLPQIWFLQELHFHKIQRMIQSGSNFVVEDKHIHLPSLNIILDTKNSTSVGRHEKLNGLAVNILIREILKRDLSGKNKLELAHLFEVNQMTVKRAIEPLLANNLCYEKKDGVSKLIYFNTQNELWDFFQTNIESPVKEIININKTPKGIPYSGMTALSERSMIGDDRVPTFAMNKKHLKKHFINEEIVLEDFAKSKIEIWNRIPILIEKSSVNLLDIYLLNKTNSDERVQIELEGLLKENNLKMRQ